MLTFTHLVTQSSRRRERYLVGKPEDPSDVGASQEFSLMSSFALDRDIQDASLPPAPTPLCFSAAPVRGHSRVSLHRGLDSWPVPTHSSPPPRFFLSLSANGVSSLPHLHPYCLASLLALPFIDWVVAAVPQRAPSDSLFALQPEPSPPNTFLVKFSNTEQS